MPYNPVTSSFREVNSTGTIEVIAYNDRRGRCFMHIPSHNVVLRDRTKNCIAYQTKITENVLESKLKKYDFESLKAKIPEELASTLAQLPEGSSGHPSFRKVCDMFFTVICLK